MKSQRGARFVVLGVAVSLASLAVQQVSLRAGVGASASTYLRLTFCVAPIYFGYSRWVLGSLYRTESARLGRWRTELRMMARVGSSVGASLALKALIEPPLTVWMLAHGGLLGAALSPLLGDYTYGPLATYVVLHATSSEPG